MFVSEYRRENYLQRVDEMANKEVKLDQYNFLLVAMSPASISAVKFNSSINDEFDLNALSGKFGNLISFQIKTFYLKHEIIRCKRVVASARSHLLFALLMSQFNLFIVFAPYRFRNSSLN